MNSHTRTGRDILDDALLNAGVSECAAGWLHHDVNPPKDGYYLTFIRYRTFLGTICYAQEVQLWTLGNGWNVRTASKVMAWRLLPKDPPAELVPRE